MANSKCIKYFGEYGVVGTGVVYEIGATKRGTVRAVAKLWRKLDEVAGQPEERNVISRLKELGAVLASGKPESDPFGCVRMKLAANSNDDDDTQAHLRQFRAMFA